MTDAFPALLEAALVRYLRIGSRRPLDVNGDPINPKPKSEFIEALEDGREKHEIVSGVQLGSLLRFYDPNDPDDPNDPVGPTPTLWIGGEPNGNRPSLVITTNVERKGAEGVEYQTVEGTPDPGYTQFMTAQLVWNQPGEDLAVTQNQARISIILEAVKTLIEHPDFFHRFRESLGPWTGAELDAIEPTKGATRKPGTDRPTNLLPLIPHTLQDPIAENGNPELDDQGNPKPALEDARFITPSIYSIGANQVELSSFRTNLSLNLPPEFTEYGLLDFTILTR